MSGEVFQVPAGEAQAALEDRARAATQAAETPAPVPAAPAVPSPAPAAPAVPVMAPQDVRRALDNLFNPVMERYEVEPLDEDELDRGAEALTPFFNRYVPWLVTTHPELVAAGMFVGGVAIRRSWKKKKAAAAPPPQTPTPAEPEKAAA